MAWVNDYYTMGTQQNHIKVGARGWDAKNPTSGTASHNGEGTQNLEFLLEQLRF